MNSQSYETHVESLKRAVWNDESVGFDDYTAGRISSNLFHLLHNVDAFQHDNLIKQVFLNQALATYDPGCFDYLLPKLLHDSQSREYSFDKSPAIICSYHYGSYRLLGPHLLTKGAKLSILIDHRVDDAKGHQFRKILDDSCRAAGAPTTMYKMRNTSEPTLLRKLLHDLREGYSLLVYIDGNIGTNPSKKLTDKADHTILVNFMDCSLHSRFGFAMLGYLSKCPILPVMLRRQGYENIIRFYPTIESGEMARDDFCRQACAAVWLHLEHVLKSDPTQWESWRYIDLSINVGLLKKRFDLAKTKLIPGTPLLFNRQRYAISERSGTPVLYDRAAYRVIPINRKVSDTFKFWMNGQIDRASNLAFLQQCYDLDILMAPEG